MTMANTISMLNAASALAAFIAAALWHQSAVAKCPVSNKPDASGWVPAYISVDDQDFIKSARLQQKWSRRGALAAAVAAVFQGLALAMSAYAAT